MSNTKGKSIKLFMVDGTPQGILTLEVMNWTGHILAGPRTKIAELVQRQEMSKTGIYFLTGPDPDGTSRTLVYIGESDNVANRIKQHNKDNTKDFWERAFVITSKDQNLTKAHARYLESRFIDIAQSVGNAKLFNGTAPKNEGLPEADIADMEYFIAQVRLILPVLGLSFLREKPQVTKHTEATQSKPEFQKIDSNHPTFEIAGRRSGIKARATEINGDFIVLENSQARSQWVGVASNYQKHYDALVTEGKIKIDSKSDTGTFQEDVVFSSPSAAAATVLGRASNGRIEWKVKGSTKTYEDWQNAQLNLDDMMA